MNPVVLVRRTASGALLLVGAYAALGFLALPALLRSQAQQQASTHLQRALTIGDIAFNPFTLELVIERIALQERGGAAVFSSAERIDLNLSAESLWRLAPVVQQVRVTQPYVQLTRDRQGRYSIDDLLALLASQPPAPEPARFSINNIELQGGRIVFDDQPANARHTVEGLRLGLPTLSSMPADVQVFVEPLLAATVNGAPLLLKGKARPFAATREMTLDLELKQVELARYLEYLPSRSAFTMRGGRLDARLRASFRQPREAGPALLIGGQIKVGDTALSDTRQQPLLKLAALDVDLGSLDVFAGKFDLASIAVDGLALTLVEQADGTLNLAGLAGAPSPPPAAPAKPATPASGIRLTLKQLLMRQGALDYRAPALQARLERFDLNLQALVLDSATRTLSVAAMDSRGAQLAVRQQRAASAAGKPAAAAGAAPYAVTIASVGLRDWSLAVDDRRRSEAVSFKLAPLALTLQDIATVPGARMRLDLQTAVRAPGQSGKPGSLGAVGQVTVAPLHVDVALDARHISLLPLQPYATDAVNLRLTQAFLSGQGRLLLDAAGGAGLKGGFKGAASIDQLATVDKASASDFVSWKSLTLTGMDVALLPLSVNIDKIALSDFFARVIIDPNGRINLQDVRQTAAGERSLTDAGERASSPAAPAAAAIPAPAAPAEPLPPIAINTLALSGGRVRFTDNFIRPNYTASLRDLAGTVSGLSSQPEANATVDLKGSVNSAPLAIAGRIHPLKRDLSLDLKAEVRGIELSTLSAYADKYVGYGIDKGKMSFEVAYQLENRQLKSDNRLILDQLTFGNESTNPAANKLPVRLAVALLSDRNGVIDISVPIGGTLDDPQFSIGGIILKIVGNAITKAVTAPFTLLASLFGNGDELSTLDFEPGMAAITPAGEGRLGGLAKALVERPGLKLDILGRAHPAADLAGLKRAALERKLRTLKTRDLQAAGAALPEGGVAVTPADYPALLARVYQDEQFDKPRNAVGLARTLPQAEMEALILANTRVGNAELLSLARRRSQAAKDWLATRGQVPAERLYIVLAQGADGSGDGTGTPSSRVDFTLR